MEIINKVQLLNSFPSLVVTIAIWYKNMHSSWFSSSALADLVAATSLESWSQTVKKCSNRYPPQSDCHLRSTKTVFCAPAEFQFNSLKLAWFRNVLLKQCTVKGHTGFFEWSDSVSAPVFSISVSMKLWKPPLETSYFSQHKCFSSSHLFSICDDSQNDLYIFLYYKVTQPAERGRGRLVACFW